VDQVSSQSYYGLWNLAEGSTIFVAPQGEENAWWNRGGADVEFSRTLLTKIEEDLCIDTSRIFCEGFSMGGSMSYAMACAMGDTIRAVAAHSGGPMSGCDPHDTPVAYYMTHGINDSVCHYPGYGVPELQDFAKTNGCTSPDPSLSKSAFADAMPDPTDSSGATPECVDFDGCDDGYPVRACIFVGDHTPTPGGRSSWVPADTWEFFTQF
jgi:poly(3-hydroxybutyrate) depolymerase